MTARANDERLRELVLYISHRNAGNPTFGKTKLHKQLWMSDFHHAQLTGESITGAKYIHMPHGPFCEPLPMLLDTMEDSGQVAIRFQQRFAYVQQVPVPLERADLSAFSADELASVEDVLWETASQSAREMSELSHLHPGWALTEDGEEIGYEYACLPIDLPLEEPLGQWAGQHPRVEVS
jgi:hypothetical protein